MLRSNSVRALKLFYLEFQDQHEYHNSVIRHERSEFSIQVFIALIIIKLSAISGLGIANMISQS